MTSPGRFESAALRINLEKTRTETPTFPDEHQFLLDATSSHYGIQRRLRHFLTEFHHRYPNREVLVESLRQIALQDLWFYAGHEEAPELLRILIALCGEQISHDYALVLRKRSLQTCLELLEHVREREDSDRFETVIDRGLELVRDIVEGDETLHTLSSGLLRGLLHRLPHDPRWEVRLAAMLRASLLRSLDYWSRETDVERWLAERPALFPGTYAHVVIYAGQPFFEKQRAMLDAAMGWDELLRVADFVSVSERITGADVCTLTLENGQSHFSRVVGVFLFLPSLLRAGLDTLVHQARLSGSSMIPPISSVLSLLALKVLDKERKSHIPDWNFDAALGWFAGLNVLPKVTATTDYAIVSSMGRRVACSPSGSAPCTRSCVPTAREPSRSTSMPSPIAAKTPDWKSSTCRCAGKPQPAS